MLYLQLIPTSNKQCHMTLKKLSIFLLPFLFTFCSSVLSAQDTLQSKSSPNDTIVSKNHSPQPEVMLLGTIKDPVVSRNHYLKPTALIVPGAFLIYGGLKPVINAIPKLDDRIWTHVQVYNPNFHTNAADYLMWVPSASVYAMDAFHVKTQHTFKEHIILDAGSILITGGIGYAMRKISQHIEVYNTHNTEFPSGHTANAFRGAEIVHQELKFSHPFLVILDTR